MLLRCLCITIIPMASYASTAQINGSKLNVVVNDQATVDIIPDGDPGGIDFEQYHFSPAPTNQTLPSSAGMDHQYLNSISGYWQGNVYHARIYLFSATNYKICTIDAIKTAENSPITVTYTNSGWAPRTQMKCVFSISGNTITANVINAS